MKILLKLWVNLFHIDWRFKGPKFQTKPFFFLLFNLRCFIMRLTFPLVENWGQNLISRCREILFNFCRNPFSLHFLPRGSLRQNWAVDPPPTPLTQPQYPLLTPLISDDLSQPCPPSILPGSKNDLSPTLSPLPTHRGRLLSISISNVTLTTQNYWANTYE